MQKTIRNIFILVLFDGVKRLNSIHFAQKGHNKFTTIAHRSLQN